MTPSAEKSSVIFESVSTVMREGRHIQRRKWNADSNRRFASDCAVKIVLCEATSKKASFVVIKRKLEQLGLKSNGQTCLLLIEDCNRSETEEKTGIR